MEEVESAKFWVVDFKPELRYENKEKVISQLFWYSRALSFRAQIPLEKIICCYFDEEVCIEFQPSKVRLNISDEKQKTQDSKASVISGFVFWFFSDVVIVR